MYERIYSYLNKNKLLTPVQFGFKQSFSTSDAVRQLFDNFAENIDQKKYTCAVLLDLKKAFDTVNHQILLAKLEKFGIRGLPLQLLESYLNNRLQFTVVNNTKSKLNHVTYGVPQGSTLESLLFLIYIINMPLVSNFNTKLFADDTVLTLTNSCPRLLNKIVNSELVKIILLSSSLEKSPVFDGAFYHLHPQIVDAATAYNILLFCLPSNTTHELQRLDKSVFRSFEH